MERLPNELKRQIFQRLYPDSLLKFLKVNKKLRCYVLKNGPFGKRLHQIVLDFEHGQIQIPSFSSKSDYLENICLTIDDQIDRHTVRLFQESVTCTNFLTHTPIYKKDEFNERDEKFLPFLKNIKIIGHLEWDDLLIGSNLMQNLQFTVLKSARIDVGANGAKERDFYRNWIRTKLDFCEAITLWDCLPLDTFSGLKGLKRLTLDSCRFLRRLPEILEKGLPNENPGFTIQFSTYFDTQMVGEMFENDERGVIEEDELRFQHLYEPFKRSTFQGFHSCSSYRKWLDDGKYLAFFGALVSDDPVNERPPGSVFLAKLLESGDKSEK